MNKRIIIGLLCAIALSTSAQTQTTFQHPFRGGNTLIYIRPNDSTREFVVISFIALERMKDTVRVEGTRRTWFLNWCPSYIAINRDRMLTATPDTELTSSSLTPALPLFEPLTDSVNMHTYDAVGRIEQTEKAVVLRRFDTTIFGVSKRAFVLRRWQFVDIDYTICELFGVVQTREFNGKIIEELSSAMIDGVKYNWDHRTWKMMPLCEGDLYRYKHNVNWWSVSEQTLRILKPTIVNGFPGYDARFSHDIYINWATDVKFFESTDGVNIEDSFGTRVFVPNNATIGMQADHCFIVDTSTVVVNGRNRRRIVAEISEPFRHILTLRETWIEGIGRITRQVHYDSGREGDTLQSASICGDTYGNPLQISPTSRQPHSPLLVEAYPNPFTTSTTIRYSLPSRGHVRLDVFDLLGRKIATLVDEEREAGANEVIFALEECTVCAKRGAFFIRLSHNLKYHNMQLRLVE